MAQILVISHGLLAQELCNSVVMIMGINISLNHISMDATQGVEKLKKDLNKQLGGLSKTGEKLIIVCDLYFGCPFISAVEFITNILSPQQCRIITGANLPMLLELCMANNTDPENLDHLVDIALRMGKEGIKEFALKIETNTSDECI